MKARRIAFVTDELYPFTAGGIGRVLHNIIQETLIRDPDIEIHIVAPETAGMQPARVEGHFGLRVKLHSVAFRASTTATVEGTAMYAPFVKSGPAVWNSQSVDFCRALKALERDGLTFDVVEFTDYRGWAFASLQEKKLGRAFATTLLSIRLHSTDGVLQHVAPRVATEEHLALYDIERKALLDADRVIAHLESIRDFNATFYGFDAAWLKRVSVEFPPVVWPIPTAPAPSTPARRNDLLFITKLEVYKGTDLFVQAAVELMMSTPTFVGRAVLVCHAFETAYREQLQNSIPASLRDRFTFIRGASEEERQRLILTGIVVIPSRFESLNLTAYEVSAVGTPLILNGACPAFGERSPFVDGESCFKFDGTVSGLAQAMHRATSGHAALSPVQWASSPPYWESLPPASPKKTETVSKSNALLSAVVINDGQASRLAQTVASLAASTCLDVEIIVVDNHSVSSLDQVMLDRIDTHGANGIRVVRLPTRRNLASARNAGVRQARGKYVALLDSGSVVHRELLETAVTALESNPEFAGVVPTLGLYRDLDELEDRRPSDYSMFLGDAPSAGLVRNVISGTPAVFRKSVLEATPFDELLAAYEEWDFGLRLVLGGARLLVTSDVQAFQPAPTRPLDRKRHYAQLARMFENLPSPLPPSIRPAALLALCSEQALALEELEAEEGEQPEGDGETEKPLRHEIVDVLNGTFKKLPIVHPFIRRTMSGLAKKPSA